MIKKNIQANTTPQVTTTECIGAGIFAKFLCVLCSSSDQTPRNIPVYNQDECVIVSLYRLCKCGVSDEGCAALTLALRSNPSHMRDLDLSENNLGDSGKKLLSALKDDEHYKLQTLMLW
ncbi:hypothetical protein QTP70_017331 [Hemibagrus guttatus]|uniref:Uncharacterized protein n=1 Tax=Hemibagrus guttatus TaxID=175788 RepID=A0AAE0QAR7_9TELE|nr:hypothetical protein QTP70_017331 [Hemibagrus guttatus]